MRKTSCNDCHCEEQRGVQERRGNLRKWDRFAQSWFPHPHLDPPPSAGGGRIRKGTIIQLAMTPRSLFVLLTLLTFLIPGISSAATAQEILERVDDLWRGESSFAEMTMEIKTEHYERSMKLKAWSLGKDHSLMLITYPPKDRGVATLKVDKDIWNYLPRVNRVIRVPTSMMMANWMGSHFTNDDLIKESRMSEDYESEVTFEGPRDGITIYELTLVPRPDAPVVWGRIEFTVIQETLIPIHGLYYDEEGLLTRTMLFSDVKTMAGREVPAVMTLIPEDKPEERTVITYDSLDLDLDLDKGFFSRANITRKDLLR